ncbi:MAG: YbaK/EbsC family protein [Oscillospiraceae bacterium]
MSFERCRAYFEPLGMASRMQAFSVSSATVELAALAVGCEGARIAKTMSFSTPEGGAMLIVTAGDAKIDNTKFKAQFHHKASMLPFDEVEPKIGHAVGGVCPFGINDGVAVYLDVSMKRFETVFPACGSDSSAIELTLPELERYSHATSWIDVCKAWQETQEGQ